MAAISGFDYFPLHFSETGDPTDSKEFDALVKAVQSKSGAEVILLAHGFRNNEDDATGLYTRFSENFAAHVKNKFQNKLGTRTFLIGGIFWPSKPFQEEEDAPQPDSKQDVLSKLDELKSVATTPQQATEIDKAKALVDAVEKSTDAQDEIADKIRAVMQDQQNDPTEGGAQFLSMSGSDAMQKLGAGPIIVPTSKGGNDDDADGGGGVQSVDFVPMETDDEGGTQGFGSFLSSLMGRLGHFINLTLWYVMKNRCGVVGGNGVAAAVRKLRALQPSPKIHLVGHSLGGRLMASCAKALSKNPVVQVESLTLLEAAFSHYGFSEDNGHKTPGFFRDVIAKKVVKGPLVCTYSIKDTVVGHVYALASRLADDNVRAIGDENDQFGGIGRNGAQKLPDIAMKMALLKAGTGDYTFASGKVWSLDGSGGLINSHGDVTNADVTYAFASAISQT